MIWRVGRGCKYRVKLSSAYYTVSYYMDYIATECRQSIDRYRMKRFSCSALVIRPMAFQLELLASPRRHILLVGKIVGNRWKIFSLFKLSAVRAAGEIGCITRWTISRYLGYFYFYFYFYFFFLNVLDWHWHFCHTSYPRFQDGLNIYREFQQQLWREMIH